MNNEVKGKLCAVLLACAGFAALPNAASAGMIEGGIGFGGLFAPTGGAGVNLSDATGIDITFSTVVAANMDFVPAVGAAAIFQHLDFNPSNTPVTPFWTVNAGAIDYSFDLMSINVDFQDNDELNLSGAGVLMATGFDNTPGVWTFSGQQGNIFFTFSSISAVSEPGMLVLMGAGLLGLAATRRRRNCEIS